MSAVMLDTDFVSVLMMPPPRATDYDLKDPKQAANYHKLSTEHLAVRQTAAAESARSNILISAAVWYELQAFAFPDGTTLASRLAGYMKLVIEEIDVSAIDLAGELVRELRAHPTFARDAWPLTRASPVRSAAVSGRASTRPPMRWS